jgi:hypothetical protein
LLYYIILSSIPLQHKEKSNAMCRETFAFSCFNHFQLALSIVGCAVPITRNLTELQLRQCVINAIRNAAYRILMGVTRLEDLPEDVLITMADFQLALADVNA